MNIRSIIIDDEPNNVENLQNLIEEYFSELEIVATAFNAADGINVIKSLQPDLIFLDIQMPGASGFDVLSAFDAIAFEIIFVTAYDQYGIQAIKFSALDYLLKPIDLSEFRLAVKKAKDKILSRKQNLGIENLLDYIKLGHREIPKIALPTLNEILYVSIDSIIRCEASNSYTYFYLQDSAKVLVCKTLKEFSDLLQPHHFIRTHQSHLVNVIFVKGYLKEDGGMLLLNDKTKIPISRQNREKVKEELNRRILISNR